METTVLKAETVTGVGFNMYIHFYFYYTILVWAKSDITVYAYENYKVHIGHGHEDI